MEKRPAEEKPPAKTEAELIATVANIQDAQGSLLFAERARKAGMPALAVACEERAKALTPIKPARAKKKSAPVKEAAGAVTPRADSDQDGADAEFAAS
jgi:hypothetical protein